jgi:hypothetical protein
VHGLLQIFKVEIEPIIVEKKAGNEVLLSIKKYKGKTSKKQTDEPFLIAFIFNV